MMKLRWLILLTALTVFLTACPGPGTSTATLSLEAEPTTLPATGGPVTLTATITEGAENVAYVEFAQGDAATVLGTDTDTADDVYTFTTSAITTTTTFIATARDANDAAIGSDEVEVTVETSSAVTLTLTAQPATLPSTGGTVTLTALITSGADQVRSVAFSEQGATGNLRVDNDATDGYTFSTRDPVTETTTFVATARGPGGTELESTTVTVTVEAGTDVPDGAILAATAAEVRAITTEGAIIAVTADLACTVTPDPCIPLQTGQTLLGASADGETLETRKITTTGSGATVVRMADDTSIEGFELDGDGIFTGILAPATITGAVTLRNITVGEVLTAGGSNPIDLNSTGAVTVEGLNIPNSIRSIDIDGFSSLTLTDSQIGYTLPATATRAFTVATGTGSASIDGLTVTLNRGSDSFSPVLINKIADGTFNVIVKNSRVIVPAASTADAIAFNFNIDSSATTGDLVIDTDESTGNTTNSDYTFADTYDRAVAPATTPTVTGSITLTKGVD